MPLHVKQSVSVDPYMWFILSKGNICLNDIHYQDQTTRSTCRDLVRNRLTCDIARNARLEQYGSLGRFCLECCSTADVTLGVQVDFSTVIWYTET